MDVSLRCLKFFFFFFFLRSTTGQNESTFAQKLVDTDLKVTTEPGTLNETLQTNHQQNSSSLSHLATPLIPPPNLTEVEEVNAEQGTIHFTGTSNSHLRRKIWVFRSEEGDSRREVSFMMEELRLRDNARLFLWSAYDGSQHEWKGSQDDWRKEQKKKGNVILVTLSISPGVAETPSFKLKFTTTATYNNIGHVSASEVVANDERKVVSFPLNNTENYLPWSSFVAVVAPPSGRPLGLTMKFLDLPDTPPDCNDTWLQVWSFEETGKGECGRVGAISDPLTNATIAILQFNNQAENVGRGFRVEFN